MFHLSIQCVWVREFINMAKNCNDTFEINDNTRLSMRSNRILKQARVPAVAGPRCPGDGLNANDIKLKKDSYLRPNSIQAKAQTLKEVYMYISKAFVKLVCSPK